MSIIRIALIPAYKPEPILIDLLQQLCDREFDIIVVDDGSGTNYASLFAEVAQYAKLITHKTNQGKGSALKTGLSYIKDHYGNNQSIIVTVDADGQHKVEDVYKVCNVGQLNPDALVLGSRKLNPNVPLRSRFGNAVTRMLYRISTSTKVYDTQTGLRAFSSNLLPDLLSVSGERYEYEMNMLLECSRRRIHILETEIETIYIDNNASSHFNVFMDSYKIYKEILKFFASSFLGFVVDYLVYGLLLILTSGLNSTTSLRIANIGARIVSASVNFIVNRKFVFKSHNSMAISAGKYFLLATAILFGNMLVLEMLVNGWDINRMLAKVLTESLFFILSWLVQRFLIFKNNKKNWR